jgi:general secretion pathway protein A
LTDLLDSPDVANRPRDTMYLEFYGLKRPAFGGTVSRATLFPTLGHREALAVLVYGVLTGKTFVALIGETGTGKTTVLHVALAQLKMHGVNVLAVLNPLLGAEALLRSVGAQLGMENADRLTIPDLERVHDRIVARCAEDGRVVLVIDEAQALPHDSLELLRLLSNFPAGQRGQLQILLVGQPNLWTTLQRPELHNLRQRIGIRTQLVRLTPTEAAEYVDFRFNLAGGHRAEIMTRGALRLMLQHADGIPRRINTISDNALITGFGAGKRPVTRRLMREAILAVGDDGRRHGLLRLAVDKVRAFLRAAATNAAAPIAAGVLTTALLLVPPAGRVEDTRLASPTETGLSERASADVAARVAPVPRAVLQATTPVASDSQSGIAIPAIPALQPPAPVEQALVTPVSATSDLVRLAVAPPPAQNPASAPVPVTVPDPGGSEHARSTVVYRMLAGDSVLHLLQRFYGQADSKALALFLSLNPGIRNPDLIDIGRDVVMPKTETLPGVAPGTEATAHP